MMLLNILSNIQKIPWGKYQNILIIFYCRSACLLYKIPTIHDKSFKAMAETYHIYKLMKLKWLLITTCAYNIQSFHTLVQTIFITHWLYLLSTAGESECVSVQILPLREKGLFGVLWGPCGSYPQFDLARFLSYILVMTYPKIIFLGLVVSEEIGVKVFRYFFALSFIR